MKNILAVDDKKENLYVLEALMDELKKTHKEGNEINVLQALSGEEALKIAMTEDIILIILDIKMPGMNGFEVAKFLKMNDKTKDIPIVFLTAEFKEEEFENRGFSIGAIDYFVKPVEKFQFLNKINLYIDLFSKNKELKIANDNLIIELERNKEKDLLILAQSRNATMGEMISMIAHQWRQPLTTISMSVNNISLDIELDDLNVNSLKTHTANIAKQTQELSNTIEDFMYFFKPNKEVEEMNVEEVYYSALNICKNFLKKSDIKIIINFEDTCDITGFSRDLMQIIINLLKNAEEALNTKKIEEKIIEVAIFENEQYIHLEISDNAGGIPPDIIHEIFNPYFSTKNVKNSSGLGLYMSKNIVEKHLNGSLEVSNMKNGACFVIKLPINLSK